MGSLAQMSTQALRRYPAGLCPDCQQPACDHLDASGMVDLGCPPHRPEAIPQNALTVLVAWFGADGVQNLLDYIENAGVTEIRRQLATLLSEKGGR